MARSTSKWHGKRLLKKTKDETVKRLFLAGFVVERIAKESFIGSKTLANAARKAQARAGAKKGRRLGERKKKDRGLPARKLGRKRRRAPSPEGGPPASQTGNLERSITTQVSKAELVARVGTNVEYSRRIELGFVGTDSLGRRYNQGPRPYLRPALAKAWPEIKQIFGAK